MKLDPGTHIGMHLVFFGKSGVTTWDGSGCRDLSILGVHLGKVQDTKKLLRITGFCKDLIAKEELHLLSVVTRTGAPTDSGGLRFR
jgi:hypothetical protein